MVLSVPGATMPPMGVLPGVTKAVLGACGSVAAGRHPVPLGIGAPRKRKTRHRSQAVVWKGAATLRVPVLCIQCVAET